MIGFRVEWDNKIGYGHLYRCLELADGLREKGQNAVFFTRSKYESYLDSSSVVELHGSSLLHDVDVLADKKVAIVVNDILDTDVGYMKKLHEKKIKSVNLDDTGEGASLASVNILSLRRPKKNDRNVISGSQYLVLRKSFSEFRAKSVKKDINNIVCNVLIVASGSEPPNMVENCILWIKSYDPTLKITLVSRNADKASRILHNDVTAVENVDASKLIDLMTKTDIGVTGCGVSAYEMACTGLPTITICKSSFETKENQIGRYGFAIQIGQAGSVQSEDMHKALVALSDPKQRKIMSDKGYNAVDGSGLSRVIAIIEELIDAR